jgi:predicted nucleotidyltransferase
MIDLTDAQLNIVESILARHVPGTEVRFFGSRIKGTARSHSDLDLAIMGKQQLPLSTLGTLIDAFQNSDLPFRVDVVDWYTISPAFQALIDSRSISIMTGEEP